MTVTKRTFDVVTSDDHNAPCILAPADAVPILAWTLHGANSNVYVKRGSGAALDFASMAATQTVTFGSQVTYAQLFRISGNDLILFARYRASSDYRWGFIRSADYGATWTAMTHLFSAPEAGHYYMDPVRVGDVLRVVLFQFAVGDIYYLEIDLVTGAITRSDGTNLGNLSGTNLPITPPTAARIYDTVTGGARLLDVSAATDPEVAFVTWTSEADATYRYLKRTSGTWGSVKTIEAAGQGLGVQSDRYYGGVSFPSPTAGGTLYLAREEAGSWYIEKHVTANGGDTWTVTELAAAGVPLVRPYCPLGRSSGPEVLWHRIPSYSSYTSWSASLNAPA